MNAVVEFDGVSKWYGNVIGLNKLTVRIAPGVTGLLGPNGAGKSTMLQLATGQLRPSQGQVRVLGHPTWNNSALMRHIGLCPEQDAFYEWMSGLDFVRTCARLTGMGRAAATAAAEKAIARVGMTENMRRGDSRLFQRDAAADQAGPGPGPRTPRAVSGRAVHAARTPSPAAT